MLSESAKLLEAMVMTHLTMSSKESVVPTEEGVAKLASSLRNAIYTVSDEEFEMIIRRLHANLRISMGLGALIKEEGHDPWLSSRRASIDPFYWTRYSRYLIQQGWPNGVVNGLDRVADDMLDLLGNPASRGGWPRRGLVMGDVQSGKTSNYTGLICKAADAGYRLVILLTGTLESLRRQTQERLDAGFVGLASAGIVARERTRREVGVGINSPRTAGVFTSTLRDFQADTINQLGFRLNSFSEPVLLVVKKNKKILENLTQWLQVYNADQSGSIDTPLLLIDDEADNASVNTNPTKATAINQAIRGLLKIFPRSSYVGFTATPFANIFINPDSVNEMLGNDLFPRDFIYSLDAPSNYIGASRIFGDADDATSGMLREILDAEDIFPLRHPSGHGVDHLPASLLRAVNSFLLVNTIMDQRKRCPLHRSMLVNVSHYTMVQEQVRDLIDDYLRRVKEDLRNYASLPVHEALCNSSITLLKEVFDAEFGGENLDWATVQHGLSEGVLPIEVRSVNQRSGAASLDYQARHATGLRVIAVGGNSLARGLTLEGLCVSYFYRNTQMYDALLQMGRWFGYRDGYDDLCRIWMSDSAINWYGHITEATDELRREVRRMQLAGLKPIDFGLKIRAHPDTIQMNSLRITARNKMRDSEEIETVISISNEGLETYRLLSDARSLEINAKVAKRLVSTLCDSYANLRAEETESRNPLWRNVPKHLVIELLKGFASHPYLIQFQASEIADFLEKTDVEQLSEWDVAIPQGADSTFFEVVPGLPIAREQRTLALDVSSRSILVNERKMRVGSRGVESHGLTASQKCQAQKTFEDDPIKKGKYVSDSYYRMVRERPLLILHFLAGLISKEPYDSGSHPLVALGLSFPRFSDNETSQRIRYMVNLVEWKNRCAILEDFTALEDCESDDDAEEVMNDEA